jgi:hypothetical protein
MSDSPAPRDRIARELFRRLYPASITTHDMNRTRESDLREADRAYGQWDSGRRDMRHERCFGIADSLLALVPVLAAEPTTDEPSDEEIARLWRKYVKSGSLPSVDGLRAMWREGADFADITASENGDTPWDREAFKAVLAAHEPETPDLHNSIRSAALAPEPADGDKGLAKLADELEGSASVLWYGRSTIPRVEMVEMLRRRSAVSPDEPKPLDPEFRTNPEVPSDEQLLEWLNLQDTTVDGLRAVWRAGCDTGMVAK